MTLLAVIFVVLTSAELPTDPGPFGLTHTNFVIIVPESFTFSHFTACLPNAIPDLDCCF